MRRELRRFLQEKSRLAGALLQPLLFWWVIGFGMSPTFRLPGVSNSSYVRYFFPGVLVMMILFNAIFSTMSLIEDRREGFLHSVLVAPGSRWSIVLGKSLGTTTIALFQSSVFLIFLPIAGFSFVNVHWFELMAGLGLGALTLAFAGFAVAWWINSTQGYHVIMSLVLLPLWVISGALFPVPRSLAVASSLNPMTSLLDICRAALAGDQSTIASWLLLIAFLILSGFLAIWVCHAKR